MGNRSWGSMLGCTQRLVNVACWMNFPSHLFRISNEKRASVDRTDQILGGGLRSNGVLESSQRILQVSAIVRMEVAKEKAPARQNASRGISLGPTLGPTRP